MSSHPSSNSNQVSADQAMLILGDCYADGRGVLKDPVQAVEWYRKAAELGNSEAMFKLGSCFAKAQGVQQDQAQAVAWYRTAAEHGNSAAMNNLGACLARGFGTPQNYAEAFAWYQKAAELGQASSMENLGHCYKLGLGVPEDPLQAETWFQKASSARKNEQSTPTTDRTVVPARQGELPLDKPAEKTSVTTYEIQAHALEGIAGFHSLALQVAGPDSPDSKQELQLGVRANASPDVIIELCHKRGNIRIAEQALFIEINRKTEVFFRLHGLQPDMVYLEVYHVGNLVELNPLIVADPFEVKASNTPVEAESSWTQPADVPAWLEGFSEARVRRLFEHLGSHGVITENEASSILGGPRQLRRFANNFEEYKLSLPFKAKIEIIGGMKRYVNEGSL